MGATVEMGSEFGFVQAVAEENNFIAITIEGIDADEGGVHADFEEVLAPAVDENRCGSYAVAVACEYDADARAIETRVSGGAARIAYAGETGGDAERRAVEGVAGTNGVEEDGMGVGERGGRRG